MKEKKVRELLMKNKGTQQITVTYDTRLDTSLEKITIKDIIRELFY